MVIIVVVAIVLIVLVALAIWFYRRFKHKIPYADIPWDSKTAKESVHLEEAVQARGQSDGVILELGDMNHERTEKRCILPRIDPNFTPNQDIFTIQITTTF